MSLALATKGIIAGYMASGGSGGDPYPIGIEGTDLDTDGIEGPFMDAHTGDLPTTPQVSFGMEVKPSEIKNASIGRVLPRLNSFPAPNNL